jgi:hypothetical protein
MNGNTIISPRNEIGQVTTIEISYNDGTSLESTTIKDKTTRKCI